MDGAIFTVPCGCCCCRDSLAKILYSKMFDWLVAAVNTAIGEDKNCAASVGVLDIYGFESFEYNDLEQVQIVLPVCPLE